MKISKIKIENLMGIQELEFKPGQITVIEGKNGTGKTSILESLKAAFKSGMDVTILRNGSKEGSIGLVFDNGDELKRKINDEGTTALVLSDKEGRSIQKPQNYLNQLVDLLATNPIEFLLSNKKDRAKILQEAMPLELDKSEIESIMSNTIIKPDLSIQNALECINSNFKAMFEERTIQNRNLKEKQATLKNMESFVESTGINPETIETQLKELEDKKERFTNQKILYIKDNNSKQDAEKTEYLRKIEEDKTNFLNILNEKYSGLNGIMEDKYIESVNPIIEEISVLREKQKQTAALESQKKMIEETKKEVADRGIKSKNLTSALDKLTELKMSLLKNLPIPGLEIRDGEIFLNDISFDRVNTAEQIKIAIEVAKLRAGEMGIICVDGLERFDADTWNEFKTQIENTDLQFICTKVGNSELSINTK